MKHILILCLFIMFFALSCKKTGTPQLHPTKIDVAGLWVGKYGQGVSRIDTSLGIPWCWIIKTNPDSIFFYFNRDTAKIPIGVRGTWILNEDTLMGSLKDAVSTDNYNFKTLLHNPFKQLDGIWGIAPSFSSKGTLFMDKK